MTTVEQISIIVKEACESEANYFGKSAWTHHILPVLQNCRFLAKELKADLETCELAALLHDFAGILNIEWYENHHLHGAKLAKEILEQYEISKKKIDLVSKSIKVHRSSVILEKEDLESKILASADTMAHIQNVPSLLFLAYNNHKLSIDEGAEWVLQKIERGWQKILPEGKVIIEKQYNAARTMLT